MTDRIQGILNRASDAPKFSGVRWILGDGVLTNYMQSYVDDTMKRNAEFQSKAGVSPKIVRKSPTKCCPWCDALVGEYKYPDDVPDDVYRRHDNCNCIVEFYPGDGKKQDVWSKQWADQDEEILADRKKVGLKPKRERVQKNRVVHGNTRLLVHHDGLSLYRIEAKTADIAQAVLNEIGKSDGLVINMDGAALTAEEVAEIVRANAEPPFHAILISADEKKIIRQIHI